MAESEIPVDLLNPGQVFACLGLMEATEILCGPCEGRFVYRGSETLGTFRLRVGGDFDPVSRPLLFLGEARVVAVIPRNSGYSASKWGIYSRDGGEIYPAATPDSPATLVTRLTDGDHEIPIEYWIDGSHVGRDNVKFWGGAGGYPGFALTRDALGLVADRGAEELAYMVADPFAFSAPMTSSFRFDWRRDYVPLDSGFSVNQHTKFMKTTGYPLVELLAAIGVQNARPDRADPKDKLGYVYGVSNRWLPTMFARTVLGGGNIGFPPRLFRMRLDLVAKEARCIVETREEERFQ